MHYRTALALTLILAVFLTSLGLTASVHASTSSASTGIEWDHFLISKGEDGDTTCREANFAERRELELINPKNLRQVNHLGDNLNALSGGGSAEGQLTIILRATANLDAATGDAPLAKAAFLRAADAWEAVINSPVTIFLDADYGPDNFGQPWGSGTLGATSSPSVGGASYSVVRGNLINGANTPAKQAIYQALPANSLPVDNGTGSTTSVSVSNSIARAIGLLSPTAQSSDSAPRIGFNSSFNFDFDPSDGITTGQTDFEAVATHEIGHALGFTSRSGQRKFHSGDVGSLPFSPGYYERHFHHRTAHYDHRWTDGELSVLFRSRSNIPTTYANRFGAGTFRWRTECLKRQQR